MSRLVPCNDLGVPMLSECPVSSVSVYSEPESPVPFPVLSGTTSGSSSSSSSSSGPSFGGEARYPERIREPSSKCKDNVSHSALAAYTSNDIDVEDPISLTEALSSPQAQAWRSAMQEEYNALIRNNTWDLVLRSRVKARGYTVIGGKWVFKTKRDSAGRVLRHKARWVARGFAQRQGIDYKDAFSPTASLKTFRILLALASKHRYSIRHIDIRNAYLHGLIDEEVYVEQPSCFEQIADQGNELVCRLKKGLYGLKQAGRQWNLRLLQEICLLGFTQCKSDSCLFVKDIGSNFLALLVFVDDIMIVGKSVSLCNSIIACLSSVFKLTDLGPLTLFLGFSVTVDANWIISLSQSHYSKSVVKRFGFEGVRSSRIPAKQNVKLVSNPTSVSATYSYDYASAVGSLMYCVVGTRVDLSASVCNICRFMSNPSIEHFYACDVVFSYLSGTCNFGLVFGGGDLQLQGYCDANWGEDLEDRRSVTGYVFVLNNAPISWCSQKQATVALSTQEAEYMSLSSACRELVWLRAVLAELGVVYNVGVTLYNDNAAAIALAKNPVQHRRNKHIDIKHHYIRELIENKVVEVKWLSGKEIPADFLTKALSYNKYKLCRDSLMHEIGGR